LLEASSSHAIVGLDELQGRGMTGVAGARHHDPHFIFVMEHGLGHVTHALNLESVLARQDDLHASVLTVRPGETRGVKPLPWVTNWSVQTSWAAREVLRADSQITGADAIFIHTQCAALFAKRIMQQVPTIVSLDATPLMFDTMAETYNHSRHIPLVEWLKLRVNRRALQAAAGIVTWSDWAAHSVVEDYGISADLVHVVPPGVQIDQFQPRGGESSSGPIRVLFVGGDFVRKGGPELMEAVASIPGVAELDVVTGTPGITPPPGAAIRVHHKVSPNSPELKSLLSRADVFALPTRGDCLSIAIVEAMACGLPIVATDVGSISEIVRNHVNGLVVAPGSSTEISRALRVLAAEPELRQTMGRTSRALAVAEHDTTANWRRIFDLLHSVSGLGRNPIAPTSTRAIRGPVAISSPVSRSGLGHD
jgi:glycosyltransferase involved in cell wall biosynthesis